MTPDRFNAHILAPGLETLYTIGGVRVSQAASRFLLTVAMQESGDLRYRYQKLSFGAGSAKSPGPARGWFGFERAGGTNGVLTHSTSSVKAKALCDWYEVEPDQYAIWRALEGHDGLSVGFARLLLLTDPHPLPTNEADAWKCYLRTWRPGKPHPEEWPRRWRAAGEVVA